jgi:hypothetical protein
VPRNKADEVPFLLFCQRFSPHPGPLLKDIAVNLRRKELKILAPVRASKYFCLHIFS